MKIIPKALCFNDVLLKPQIGKVKSRSDCLLDMEVLDGIVMSCPIISANMVSVTDANLLKTIIPLGSNGIIHQFQTIESAIAQIEQIKSITNNIMCAVGIQDWQQRIEAYTKHNVNIIVLDVAHAGNTNIINEAKAIRKTYPKIQLVVGNIATAEEANAYARLNVDAVKVGIGPGAACTTRVASGHGVPQLQAIMDVKEVLPCWCKLWADGGIETPGDAVKSFAAGADAIVCGKLFAGTTESPAELYTEHRGSAVIEHKIYYGSASVTHKLKVNPLTSLTDFVEGEQVLIPHTGSVKIVLKKFIQGLQSGVSYGGVTCLHELYKTAIFIPVSDNVLKENGTRE